MKNELVKLVKAIKEENGFNRNVELALDEFVEKVNDLKIEIAEIKGIVIELVSQINTKTEENVNDE